MSTLATTNIKHESASTPNITLTSGGATTVNGTLNLGSSPLATPTGSAPSYTCRAWVNFDGTGTFSPNPSTTKIRASGNVSSITDLGTGNYRVNFTTAMPDADYACCSGTGGTNAIVDDNEQATTTTFEIITKGLSGSPQDQLIVSLSFFR